MRSGLPASQDRSERTASLAASTGGRAALITRGVRQVTKRALHVRSGTAYTRPKIFDDSSVGESENDTNDETNDESGTVMESTEDETEGDISASSTSTTSTTLATAKDRQKDKSKNIGKTTTKLREQPKEPNGSSVEVPPVPIFVNPQVQLFQQQQRQQHHQYFQQMQRQLYLQQQKEERSNKSISNSVPFPLLGVNQSTLRTVAFGEELERDKEGNIIGIGDRDGNYFDETEFFDGISTNSLEFDAMSDAPDKRTPVRVRRQNYLLQQQKAQPTTTVVAAMPPRFQAEEYDYTVGDNSDYDTGEMIENRDMDEDDEQHEDNGKANEKEMRYVSSVTDQQRSHQSQLYPLDHNFNSSSIPFDSDEEEVEEREGDRIEHVERDEDDKIDEVDFERPQNREEGEEMNENSHIVDYELQSSTILPSSSLPLNSDIDRDTIVRLGGSKPKLPHTSSDDTPKVVNEERGKDGSDYHGQELEEEDRASITSFDETVTMVPVVPTRPSTDPLIHTNDATRRSQVPLNLPISQHSHNRRAGSQGEFIKPLPRRPISTTAIITASSRGSSTNPLPFSPAIPYTRQDGSKMVHSFTSPSIPVIPSSFDIGIQTDSTPFANRLARVDELREKEKVAEKVSPREEQSQTQDQIVGYETPTNLRREKQGKVGESNNIRGTISSRPNSQLAIDPLFSPFSPYNASALALTPGTSASTKAAEKEQIVYDSVDESGDGSDTSDASLDEDDPFIGVYYDNLYRIMNQQYAALVARDMSEDEKTALWQNIGNHVIRWYKKTAKKDPQTSQWKRFETYRPPPPFSPVIQRTSRSSRREKTDHEELYGDHYEQYEDRTSRLARNQYALYSDQTLDGRDRISHQIRGESYSERYDGRMSERYDERYDERYRSFDPYEQMAFQREREREIILQQQLQQQQHQLQLQAQFLRQQNLNASQYIGLRPGSTVPLTNLHKHDFPHGDIDVDTDTDADAGVYLNPSVYVDEFGIPHSRGTFQVDSGSRATSTKPLFVPDAPFNPEDYVDPRNHQLNISLDAKNMYLEQQRAYEQEKTLSHDMDKTNDVLTEVNTDRDVNVDIEIDVDAEHFDEMNDMNPDFNSNEDQDRKEKPISTTLASPAKPIISAASPVVSPINPPSAPSVVPATGPVKRGRGRPKGSGKGVRRPHADDITQLGIELINSDVREGLLDSSTSSAEGTRRSSRESFPPLRYWRNEYAVYKRDSEGLGRVAPKRIGFVTVNDDDDGVEKKKTRRGPKKKKLDWDTAVGALELEFLRPRSRFRTMFTVREGEGQRPAPSNCVSARSQVLLTELLPEEEEDDEDSNDSDWEEEETKRMNREDDEDEDDMDEEGKSKSTKKKAKRTYALGGKSFEKPVFSSGFLDIPPTGMKMPVITETFEVYYVITTEHEKLKMTLEGEEGYLATGDTISVPPGNVLEFENLSTKHEAKLFFTIIETEQTLAQLHAQAMMQAKAQARAQLQLGVTTTTNSAMNTSVYRQGQGQTQEKEKGNVKVKMPENPNYIPPKPKTQPRTRENEFEKEDENDSERERSENDSENDSNNDNYMLRASSPMTPLSPRSTSRISMKNIRAEIDALNVKVKREGDYDESEKSGRITSKFPFRAGPKDSGRVGIENIARESSSMHFSTANQTNSLFDANISHDEQSQGSDEDERFSEEKTEKRQNTSFRESPNMNTIKENGRESPSEDENSDGDEVKNYQSRAKKQTKRPKAAPKTKTTPRTTPKKAKQGKRDSRKRTLDSEDDFSEDERVGNITESVPVRTSMRRRTVDYRGDDFDDSQVQPKKQSTKSATKKTDEASEDDKLESDGASDSSDRDNGPKPKRRRRSSLKN